jgi:hypothetical protein
MARAVPRPKHGALLSQPKSVELLGGASIPKYEGISGDTNRIVGRRDALPSMVTHAGYGFAESGSKDCA